MFDNLLGQSLGKIDETRLIRAYFGSLLDGAWQFVCFFNPQAINIELGGGEEEKIQNNVELQ